MDRDLRRQLLTVVTYVITVIVNGAAVAIPLGGMTTAQISDLFPVPIVPANYVFSIWSAIYLLLLGFTVWQALPSRRTDPTLRRLGYLPALTGVLNTVWVLLWQYQVFALTVPVMIALLATLIAIWLRVREPREVAPAAAQGWLVALPFSVYLGWITVATIANITQMLYWAGVREVLLSGPAWGALILVVGLAIATVMVLRGRDIAYGMVIAWAYAGIAAKQSAVELVPAVAIAGAAWMLLLIVATILGPMVRSARGTPSIRPA
ncbi:MAG: tryptophan-rich sensory protein [Chloroflexota bacterium]